MSMEATTTTTGNNITNGEIIAATSDLLIAILETSVLPTHTARDMQDELSYRGIVPQVHNGAVIWVAK